MSLYGHDKKTTPFLDYIAKKSVVFENCYSQAPWTKPSVGAILSSRYPSETGVHRTFQYLSSSYETLTEALKKGGYYTKGVSANPLMGRFSNYSQGFDEFTESARINRADPIRFASGSAKLLNDLIFPWLSDIDRWPLFLFMFSVDPHEEYEPAAAFLKKFSNPDKMEQYRTEWKALLKTRPKVPGNRVVQKNFIEADVEAMQFIDQGLGLYDADICANDYQLLKLFSRIEDAGWGDDMIFILTSDHGEEFFDHGGTCHAYSLYNELLHVPLLIYAPGLLPEGKRITNPVMTIDIYPTLLEMLDIAVPEGIKGKSLLPLINEDPSWDDRPVYAENTEDPGGRLMGSGAGVTKTIIVKPWKLIINFKSPSDMNKPKYELFNLDSDPGEKKNLAKIHPSLVRQFEDKIMHWASSMIVNSGKSDEEIEENVDPEIIEQLKKLGYIK